MVPPNPRKLALSRAAELVDAREAPPPLRCPVTDRKIVPFRKRPPSLPELVIYQQATRRWHPQMQQLLFPEHFRLEPPRPPGKK